MINLHKDHANLVNISLLVYVLLSTGIAVAPALSMQDSNVPLPGMPEMTRQERDGLAVYVAEGCMGCHTQQVRNIEMDKTWGSRPSIPSDYYYSKQRMNIWQQSPSLLGSERTGPDLTNVGVRRGSEQWQLLHLYDPRMVVEGSIMPRYGWLFREVDSAQVKPDDVVLAIAEDKLPAPGKRVVATKKANDLVAYLLSLKQAPLPSGAVPQAFLPSPGAKKAGAPGEVETGAVDGSAVFAQVCAACHQADAQGLPGAFPPLAGSSVVNDKDPTLMIDIVLAGYNGRASQGYGPMPPQAEVLNDEEIAAVVSYVRSNFGNDASATSVEAVATQRAVVAPQTASK